MTAMDCATHIRSRTRPPTGSARPKLPALLLALLVTACQMDSTEHDAAPAPSGAPDQVSIGLVLWYVDYAAALQVAREEDKALWVHFGENPG